MYFESTIYKIPKKYSVALANAINQSVVSAMHGLFGYSAVVIQKGTKLLAQTTTTLENSKKKDNETIADRAVLDNKISEELICILWTER